MFSSLRARLLLSYGFLVVVTLIVVAFGALFAVQRSPLLYRNVVNQLLNKAQKLEPQVLNRLDQPADVQSAYLQSATAGTNLRLAIVQKNGKPVAVSFTQRFPRLGAANAASLVQTGGDPVPGVMSTAQGAWVYVAVALNDNADLLVMTARPVLPLREILRNELIGPILEAGIAALVLAIILSLLMGAWILGPLRRISYSARQVADGNYPRMKPEGPREIRQLADAFNEMSQKVQDSQKSQRDFIANVSHELKTPLTSIQGFAQAIADGTANTPETLKQAAEVIQVEASRMHRLVTDLLTLARLETGTASMEWKEVDLNQLVAGVAQKFSLLAQQANVVLQTQLSEIPLVHGDGDRLAQVFSNLVDNALKFTPSGGSIRLSSKMDDHAALIQVSDSGAGISPEDRARIFERFYQVDKARKGGMGRGVGLGLAISRQIILAHHGDLSVQSEIGKGSTFSVRIPLTGPDDPTLNRKRTRV